MNRRFSLLIWWSIMYLYPPAINAQQTPQYTFITKCVSCHKNSADAPFSLATSKEVTKRARMLTDIISSGVMPPWKADNNYCTYSNDRALTNEEKSSLISWIKSGAKGLDQTISKSTVNTLKRPDLTISSGEIYKVKGDNVERFIVLKVPFEIEKEENIEGIEFISNDKRIIHHINYGIFAVPDTSIDIKNGNKFIETDDPRANKAEYDHLAKQPVYYTGWIPGSSTEYYPKNFGWVLPKRGVVIFTIHYSASPTEVTSSVGIHLYFKKDPIERKVKIISFGSGGIGEKDITPHFVILPDKINHFELRMMTRDAQSVMYVWPHMHFLGKSFKAYAIPPTGDTIPLISIPKWDYKWQEMYRMRRLTKIPAGSILVMQGQYDNTSNNPFNPNSPPKTVFSTKDMTSNMEMFTLLMIYVPYKEGDENITL